MAGLTVAQISEFSLILMSLGLSLGHVDQNAVTLITLVGITTIAGSTYFVIYADWIYEKLQPLLNIISFNKSGSREHEILDQVYDVMIFGFGRVGMEFVQKAKEKDLSYLAVDYNPEVFHASRTDNVTYRFGDVEDVEFLEEINMYQSNTVISTIPDSYISYFLIRKYRERNKTGKIIVTSYDATEAIRLYEMGATYVILPHYLGAHHAGGVVFESDPQVLKKEQDIQYEQIKKHLQFIA